MLPCSLSHASCCYIKIRGQIMKKIILLFIFIFFAGNAGAASIGPQNPTAASTDSGLEGQVDWRDPTNVFSITDSGASAEAVYSDAGLCPPTLLTYYLKATDYDFSSLPSSATINGIQVDIYKKRGGATGAPVYDNEVYLIDGSGTFKGDNYAATGIAWETSITQATYGGPTDLWNTTWTPSDIKDADFGVAILAVFSDIWSFSADTMISTNNGKKRIDEIKAGDMVLSFNETTQTKEMDSVVDVSRHTIDEMLEISFGKDKIKVSASHKLYTKKGWIEAGDVKVGDKLLKEDLTDVIVTKIRKKKERLEVWDLTTAQNHNFFASGVLVHNVGCEIIASVDGIQVTVYYTPGASTIKNAVIRNAVIR